MANQLDRRPTLHPEVRGHIADGIKGASPHFWDIFRNNENRVKHPRGSTEHKIHLLRTLVSGGLALAALAEGLIKARDAHRRHTAQQQLPPATPAEQ